MGKTCENCEHIEIHQEYFGRIAVCNKTNHVVPQDSAKGEIIFTRVPKSCPIKE